MHGGGGAGRSQGHSSQNMPDPAFSVQACWGLSKPQTGFASVTGQSARRLQLALEKAGRWGGGVHGDADPGPAA